MSENLKCPVCQKGSIMFRENLSCECSQCRFQCHHGQIERIAAAMELAKAKHKRMTTNRNIFGDWDDNDENLHQAERRVLEVFNG